MLAKKQKVLTTRTLWNIQFKKKKKKYFARYAALSRYTIFFWRNIFFHINPPFYLNMRLTRVSSCFCNSCRNVHCSIRQFVVIKIFGELICTVLCTYTELEMYKFPPMRIYTRHFSLLIGGPHHKTLGISAWPRAGASKVGREIFHRCVKFYFRAFVRPDYRFRPQCAGRGPRPVAELLDDSQIKSCLADK